MEYFTPLWSSLSIYRCKCLFNGGVDEVVDGFKKILFYCRLSLFGFAEYLEVFREEGIVVIETELGFLLARILE